MVPRRRLELPRPFGHEHLKLEQSTNGLNHQDFVTPAFERVKKLSLCDSPVPANRDSLSGSDDRGE
jgi:hypothetical protein